MDVYITRPPWEGSKVPVQIVPATQLETRLFQRRDIAFLVCDVADTDLDVDGGLRRQSGHGSRTDVLDAPGRRVKVLGDECSPGRKSSRPLNVVWDDCDRVATIAAHGDRESRPHEGHSRACESQALL